MKKNITIAWLVVLIVLSIIAFVFFNKKQDKIITNSSKNSSLANIPKGLEIDLPKKQIEKEKKIAKENVPAMKPYKQLVKQNKWENKIKEEKKVVNKLEEYWYNNQLDSYLKAICGDKTNIDDITCSSQFTFFEPRLFSFLLSTKKNLNISYDDLMWFLISWIQRNCSQVKWQNLELLIRAFKENDTTCTKDVTKIYNTKYAELSDLFKNYELSEKTLSKPFKVYYGISNDLTDVKQRNLQILILENINKQAKKKYWSSEKFKKEVLTYVWAETEENLKQLILKDYENLFKKYKLEDCGLKLEWYDNYFVWIPIERKAVKCVEKKTLDKWFKTDYNKLMEKLSAYSYTSKVFLWEKAVAKALFWQEGIWITNILDINAIVNENQKK